MVLLWLLISLTYTHFIYSSPISRLGRTSLRRQQSPRCCYHHGEDNSITPPHSFRTSIHQIPTTATAIDTKSSFSVFEACLDQLGSFAIKVHSDISLILECGRVSLRFLNLPQENRSIIMAHTEIFRPWRIQHTVGQSFGSNINLVCRQMQQEYAESFGIIKSLPCQCTADLVAFISCLDARFCLSDFWAPLSQL